MSRIIRQILAAAAFMGLGATAFGLAATTGDATIDALLIRDDEPRVTEIDWQTAAQPIPEPTSIALVMLAAFAVLTRRWSRTRAVATTTVCAGAAVLLATSGAQAKLGGFDTSDGYSTPFPMDVWMYDAGQTGAPFIPINYNTGRWAELFGSGNAGGDSQYMSQHGYSFGGANAPPFALTVRAVSPSTNGSYDQTVRYSVGADDTGVSPSTPLLSAQVDFDVYPGTTIIPGAGPDTVFNNVPAFSLSFGGTNTSPGVTIGFTDNDPGNSLRTQFFHNNGATMVSQVMAWSGRFDHVSVAMNTVTNTYSVTVTPDFNLITPEFDPGNLPAITIAGAANTNPFSLLDNMYFRAHTDPSNGSQIGGLEKSFLDNFAFSVLAPEPTSALTMLVVSGVALLARRRR